MEGASHLIARQTVEVVGTDRAECEALAARTALASANLAAAVERGLDMVGAEGERLRLGRVELDLGPCSPTCWEHELAEGIKGRLPELIKGAVRRSEAERSDPAEAALLLLDEFARSGRLPWWCSAPDSPRAAVRTLVLQGCVAEEVRRILHRPQSVERLVNQLEDRELSGLVQLARPELGTDPQLLIASLSKAARSGGRKSKGGPRAVPPALWRAALEVAGEAPVPPRHGAAGTADRSAGARLALFIEAILARCGLTAGAGEGPGRTDGPLPPWLRASRTRDGNERTSRSVSAAVLRLAGEAGSPALEIARRIASIVERLDSHLLAEAADLLERFPGPSGLLALGAMLEKKGMIGAADTAQFTEAAQLARPPEKSSVGDDEHDSVAVRNSGIVITWPLLPAFFGTLGLIEDDCLRDPPARHRAAALLHYLGSGDLACPEEEMPLAKILAGLGLDDIHEPGEPLDEHETRSADALLDAVLGHAPMLGKISREGFRRSFLVRPGSLTTRDGHWLLRVERQGIDVLLDRIPWGFSWVQEPWMEVPLRVEW